MKAFTEMTEAVGWTLINSLWQGLAVMGLVMVLIHFLSSRSSQLRYAIACAGLVLTILLNISTFIYLVNKKEVQPKETTTLSFQYSPSQNIATEEFTFQSLVSDTRIFLESNMSLIILLWSVGALLFTLRMISGWWYITRLQSEASVFQDEWNDRLQSLARQLNINRVVTLAQCARIHAPIVVGFLKPIVLVPTAMLAGLSTEQIETIFLHELAHIRRHDYIVNIVQSFIEAIFFFNPFIWTMSNIIRREREYCCDDAVLTKGSPIAYARALAHLEEVRLSKTMFALSLAENKNQLLNRIKRIMEKSAKNYSGRDRLVPALLLVVGLICASWLTIRTDQHKSALQKESATATLAADTTIKKKETPRSSSKTTIITFDDNGQPHEQIIEDYNGEIFESMSSNFEMPPMPAIPGIPSITPMPSFPSVMASPSMQSIPAIAPMPGVHSIPAIPAIAAFQGGFYWNDTIPRSMRSEREWIEFSQAFEEKFREQFEDFYKNHEKDFDKMMKELEQNFSERFNDQAWANFDDQVSGHFRTLSDLSHDEMIEMEEQAREAHEHARDAQHEAIELQEEAAQHARESDEDHSQHMAEELRQQAEELKEIEKGLKEMEVNMKDFQKDLQAMLIKDGYIGKSDKVKNINWDDDGEIEVNGKKIKSEDRDRYNDLHRKYFKKRDQIRIIE